MKISQHNSPPPPQPSSSQNDPKTLGVGYSNASSTGTTQQSNKTTFALEQALDRGPSPAQVSEADLEDLIENIGGELDQSDALEASEGFDRGSFFEFMKGLSEGERQELRGFRQEIMKAARDGGLDEAKTAALVEKAPAALKEFAFSQGISIEQFIEQSANRPPRERSLLQMEMREFFKSQGGEPRQEGMREFFQQFREVMQNDGDMVALESEAPQILRDFAEHKGISLTDLLGQLGRDIQAHGPRGPRSKTRE